MTKDAIRKILDNHSLWLKTTSNQGLCANFRHADLRHANFRHADLRHADLRHANFRHADLRHVDFRHADLRHADLRHTDLRHTDFRGTDLRGTDFYGVNIRHADFRGADLAFTSFPLSCGSFDIKVDDRIASQLLYHIKQLNFEGCSTGLRKQLKSLIDNNKSLFSKFEQYRDDLKGQL